VVLTSTDRRGVATVTLNRPEVNNAYNAEVIGGLTAAFGALAADDVVRVVLLRGNGRHFQAGADLRWIKSLRSLSAEENVRVSRNTTDAARGLNEFPKPVLALIHGGCFGGGVGIAAACDVVIASEDAIFSITEARWGLMAGPIIPQLIARMGPRNVRRYAMTCERFGAERAQAVGLVDEVCPTDGLDAAAAPIVDDLLRSAPGALASTKACTLRLARGLVDDALAEELAREHAATRLLDEAVEGLDSFLERRDPSWYPGPTEEPGDT
jgi:methylglutaconyl-CoA hydratase